MLQNVLVSKLINMNVPGKVTDWIWEWESCTEHQIYLNNLEGVYDIANMLKSTILIHEIPRFVKIDSKGKMLTARLVGMISTACVKCSMCRYKRFGLEETEPDSWHRKILYANT